jgi:hypothetical protein
MIEKMMNIMKKNMRKTADLDNEYSEEDYDSRTIQPTEPQAYIDDEPQADTDDEAYNDIIKDTQQEIAD